MRRMKRLSSGNRYVSYSLGQISITSLHDGYVELPPERLRAPGDVPVAENVAARTALVSGKLRLSVNAFAVSEGHPRHAH